YNYRNVALYRKKDYRKGRRREKVTGMKNTNLLTLILVIIVLAGLLALAVNGCNKKQRVSAPPTFTQKQIDSVLKNNEESVKVINELVNRNNKVTLQKDSLLAIVDETGRK